MERLLRGSGLSSLDVAGDAGRDAAAAALAALDGASPRLVLVYASARYDLPALLAGVRSVTGPAPLAGATSSGHFACDQVVPPGTGVAVLALAGGPYRFGVASAPGVADDPGGAGSAVARAAKAAAAPRPTGGPAGHAGHITHAALVLLTGSLGGDQQAVLTGVHRVGGAAVPVIGGAAADDGRLRRTSVFHDDQVLSDAAVGVWISSPRPLTVAGAHGWTAVGDPLLITRAEGSTIHEIGDRPAGDVYAELVAAAGGAGGTDRRFGLGLVEPDGSHLVRVVPGGPGATVTTMTPVPAYSAVQLVRVDRAAVLDVVDGVVGAAMAHGDESVLLAFDCVTRRDILGDDHDEVTRIAKAAGDAHPFGVLTYGEFARARGVGGVHNAALTALAL